MPLTDAKVRAEKPGASVRKVSDGGGLQLWVTPTGVRTWRVAFRHADKQKAVGLGQYPAISLAAARLARDAVKKVLASGGNPLEQQDEIKIALDTARRMDLGLSSRDAGVAAAQAAALRTTGGGTDTFGVIADELIEKLRREKRAEATLTKVTWLLDFARPALADKSIRSITAADVLEVLRRVERRGRHETARRLRSTIGSVFRYAIATARAKDDPTIALHGALTTPTVRHRAAVTDAKGLGALLRAIDGFDGQPTTKAALNLLALLFARPGELRMAEWTEFDLSGASWTIPASRTKLRREHRKPLPAQAIVILKALKEITGTSRYLFPSVRSWHRSISENTLNAALRRMGYTAEEATSHGFRATASTLLNEFGKWSSQAIERELDHQERDAVRRAYARGQHWSERVAMMQWWADHLDTLRQGAKVIALRV